MSIQHLGKIDHLDIYFDPNSDSNFITFGRKGSEQPIGIVYVLTDKLGNIKAVESSRSKRTKEDYQFAIGSFSTLEPYQKALKSL